MQKNFGIPWGISEAAFNLKDLHSNYQYKAFGIPWLGLKRGLADEMVTSTYGSVLAVTDEPNEVIKNLKSKKQKTPRLARKDEKMRCFVNIYLHICGFCCLFAYVSRNKKSDFFEKMSG